MYGPLGTKTTINSPPSTEIPEVTQITSSHGKCVLNPCIKLGQAVPKTRAPTRNPNDLPKPAL